MNKFLILFKHELKSQLPLPRLKGRRYDLFGMLLLSLVVMLVAAVFVTLFSAIVSSYTLVRIDKVAEPTLRAREMLNVFYMASFLILVLAGLENMRRSLTDHKYKELYLRLPVRSETIFFSKLLTLLISGYAFAFVLIATVTVIFYTSADLPLSFIFRSLAVWVLMPLSAFLISTLLLVPYIRFIEFISDKYLLLLILVSSLVMGAFFLYSRFLNVLKNLIGTGSIKYLFNEKFVNALSDMLKWAYPVNLFTEIAVGRGVVLPVLAVLFISALAPLAVYLISKKLFTATIYKNEKPKRPMGKRKQKRKLSPIASLLKKEFISIYRDPKSMFSYFAVAASMPVMVYCCYTLFNSLVIGAIGMKVSFPLATFTVLIFSILTNTFCATNVSRDGSAAIKVKTYPVKASTILFAKVLFCSLVSSLSVIASLTVLVFWAELSLFDAVIAALITIAFSLAQIFVATRMDLSGARLSSSLAEMRSASNITVVKVVMLGIVLALISGTLSLVSYILSLESSITVIKDIGFTLLDAYLLPGIISALYLVFAIAYYRIGIEKSLDALSL